MFVPRACLAAFLEVSLGIGVIVAGLGVATSCCVRMLFQSPLLAPLELVVALPPRCSICVLLAFVHVVIVPRLAILEIAA